MTIRPLTAADIPSASALLDAALGGRMQARRGELVDVLEGGAGLLALDDAGAALGIVSWFIEARGGGGAVGDVAEIRALAVADRARGQGLGHRLLDETAFALHRAGLDRAWLVTTNDNLAALALYQKAGFRLVALRAGAIDDLRRTIKPSIPNRGANGIPLRDELELELTL